MDKLSLPFLMIKFEMTGYGAIIAGVILAAMISTIFAAGWFAHKKIHKNGMIQRR